MEKLILKSLTALSLLTLAACSGAEVTDISGIDSSSLVSGSFTQYDSNKIEGSGTIRFTNTLPVLSSRSMALKASLDSTIAMSSVSVVFYSANAAISSTDGIIVTFSRSGASVIGQISFNTTTAAINSSKLSFYFPTSLDVIVEVHNINAKARVLIWRRNMVEYSPATADVDTDRAGDLDSTLPIQQGAGIYVGLIIENSSVTAARVDTQKVLD